jgi:hypothetical protein
MVRGMAVIYGLFDPRKPIELENCRYIGQTVRALELRVYEHCSSAQRSSLDPVHCWIRSLGGDGVDPTPLVLQDVDEQDLDQCETEWIALGRDAGWALLNVTNGGDGWRSRKALSEAHRAKIGESVRRAFEADPTFGPRIGQSLRRYYEENPEAHERLSEGKRRKYASDPTYAQRIAEAGRRRFADPEERRKASEAGKAAHARDPERRRRVGAQATERFQDPQERARLSQRLQAVYEDPALRARVGAAVSAARAKEDKSPLMCPICGKGPFKGPRALRLHQTRMGCDQ